MSLFYIKSVTACGESVKDSSVDFSKGLNIITGYSDTGKTCVVQCIDYIFGSKIIPFEKSTGYNSVVMVVDTNSGVIQFKRYIGKNQVEIISHNADIKSDTYVLDYKKEQKRPVLNEVWLKLIGIEAEHFVPSNKSYEKKRLTWKTMRSLRFLDEESIGRAESIIEPVQYVEKTLFLSSLLFLLNGHDFSEVDVKKNNEIKKAKKKAVEEYVNVQIKNTSNRHKELVEVLKMCDFKDVDSELERIINEIEKMDTEFTDKANSSKALTDEIIKYNSRLAEYDVLLSRYSSLSSQYTSDIKRLTFIVDGEDKEKDIPHNSICPFCSGKLSKKNSESYIMASRAELSRIIAQMNGLAESINNVQTSQIEVRESLNRCQEEQSIIDNYLKNELKPSLENLGKEKEACNKYVEIKKELSMLEDMSTKWNDDLKELALVDEEKENKAYHPKEYFGDSFMEKMDLYANEILKECKYENFLSARFNLHDFDIEVNGGKKATNHGKGYRAFLNTIVALMFRKYFAAEAKYNPGMLVIDTPLLGLDQGVEDAAPESMRKALFNYFINNQQDGQLIVVENWEHIPKMEYEKQNVNVIKFTKGHDDGRYGFLQDLK